MGRFLDIALETARKGYPVFPLKPRSKEPIYKGGFHIATRDEAQIRAWWRERPDANIAVPTGDRAGISVVDVDGKNGVESIKQSLGSLPETRMIKTPHGKHLVYMYDPSFHNGAELLPNVDIRSDGGYIVWSGSVVDCDKDDRCTDHDPEYKLARDVFPISIGAVPEVFQKRYKPKANSSPSNNGAVPEGKRNDTLVRLAGRLRTAGLSADAIAVALLKHNEESCVPPLPEEEVYSIAKQADGWDRGQDNSDHVLPDANRLLSQFVRPEDWLDDPEPPIVWVVDGLLAEDSFTMLSAYPKEGKSTFARHLALAVARGEDFLGRATKQGTVLYFALEEMERDVRAKFRALGVQKGDPLLLRFHSAYPAILDDLRELIKTEKPQLIVMDTLVRLPKPKFESGDSSGGYWAVGTWVDPLLTIAHEDKATMLGVYHATKAGRGVEGPDAILAILGSTGMGGAIDQLIYITQAQDETRAFGAIGRLPNIAPTLMSFDEETQRLSSLGGKAEVKWNTDRETVYEAVTEDGWMDRDGIKDEAKIGNANLGAHLKYLVENKWLITKKAGNSGKKSFYQRASIDSAIPPPSTESQNHGLEVEVI